jgi:hypothetical protein
MVISEFFKKSSKSGGYFGGIFSQNILSTSLCTQCYVKNNPNYLNTSKITMGA